LYRYTLSIGYINTGVRAYLETKWTATYNFTITPLLIITPLLLLIVVGVPILCFNQMQREEIMQRLDESIE
jgi:putative ABC transport system permease protein